MDDSAKPFWFTIFIGLLVGCAVGALALAARAQERVDLTAPFTYPNETFCTVTELVFSTSPATVSVTLTCEQGKKIFKTYNASTTPTGATLLSNLNRANFSGANPSFIKSVYNRLIADGVISGTVSGTPQ